MSDAPITSKFQTKAPQIMRLLVDALSDYDLSDEDAAAILGNFGTETGGFSLRLEEGKPKENQGFGWAQWTGYDPNKSDRRLLFENWCKANGYSDVVKNPSSSPEDRYDEACYGYLVYEISETWEERVLTKGGTISGVFYPPLCDCSSLDQKTVSFMKLFERPGTPHEDWRREMAHEALRLYRGEPGGKTMPYSAVCISSGHGLYVRGASGVKSGGFDEVDEARRLTDDVAEELQRRGVTVRVFHDNTSHDQNTNLSTITKWHNSQPAHDLDISCHFNAYDTKAHGTEVLFYNESKLASEMSKAIAFAGSFTDRGGKQNKNLAFLKNTKAPAILLETCFCDCAADANLYFEHYDRIVDAIATTLGGEEEDTFIPVPEPEPIEPPEDIILPRVDIQVSGEVLIFVNGEQVGTKG